ncbi:sugar transferase [Nocardia sp. NPDC052566]|uniref:sugar transferase n=1 Tax=Nocardia sp. NPDC052566 TaxID=3364330 RepID=UPI0037C85265
MSLGFEIHGSDLITGNSSESAERISWQEKFARRLFVTDLAIVLIAVAAAQWLHIQGPTHNPLRWQLTDKAGSLPISSLIAVAWMICLALWGTRSTVIVGSGTAEYRSVTSATLILFGVIAIGTHVLQTGGMRDYFGIALPLGLFGLIASRRLWRTHIAQRRARGEYLTSVLLVGSKGAAHDMAAEFARDSTGYRVVGVCTPDGRGDGGDADIRVGDRAIPVVGDADSVVQAVRHTGADVVAVVATDAAVTTDFRRITWDLEAVDAGLLVAPGIADIAQDRLTNRFVSDLLVVQIDKPQYSRAMSIRKMIFDRCFALTAVLCTLPVLLVVAVAIKLTSKGPVFYLSERIGLRGKPFRMIKFRTMYVDADAQMAALIASNGAAPMFFKLKNDPRITEIGRLLRKFSIDELPQFLNVLRGDMSVVGPRPQVRREVETYDAVASRRLLVKPGITGLWQVSGRSDLTPAAAIGLDTFYVDNWSMRLDFSIIAKTIRTVTSGEGAY